MQVLNRPTCTEREFWEGAAKNTFHMTLLRHSHPGRCRRGSGYNLLDHPSDINATADFRDSIRFWQVMKLVTFECAVRCSHF